MKKKIALAAAGGVIGILLFIFLFYNEPDMWQRYGRIILLSGLTGILLAFVLNAVSTLTGRWTRWHHQPGVSLMVSVIANTIIVFGITSAYLTLFFNPFPEEQDGLFTKLAILSFVVVLLYSVAWLVISSFRYLQKSMLDAVQLEARQTDLQLKALKSQLTPHFLFNSLNTISSLMHKDQALTEKYIRNLARIYQYTLPAYDKKLVSFKEEWGFVSANLELLRVRFGEGLVVNLENETDLQKINMPPLTLQLLMENALKHNRIEISDPLKIVIAARGSGWQVTNNLTGNPGKVSSFHVGLRIIRERYELMGHTVDVRNDKSFTVTLPVL